MQIFISTISRDVDKSINENKNNKLLRFNHFFWLLTDMFHEHYLKLTTAIDLELEI